jgi:regulator of protease activity HflC (stomatin/prohibitin superfamily)
MFSRQVARRSFFGGGRSRIEDIG